jgi:hypothetical protein
LQVPNLPRTRRFPARTYSGLMRARVTTVLLVIAALALPAVMALAVFYASDQAIGDTPGGVTPQFGVNVQPITTVPPTTREPEHHRRHRDRSGSTTTATTAGTDDHGGSTSGRSPGGSGSSGSGSSGGSGSTSGGGGHGGDDGGGDS